jgi:COP9 signalosome complex subunit 7
MDQSYAKALAALQPFIHLATTTKSPSHRFLADLITRATSAPGTYIFTELLQLPAIQSLRAADVSTEYSAYLTLLELFSWGTYEEYKSKTSLHLHGRLLTPTDTTDLPNLNEAQTLKLQQLSLLTIASPFLPSTTSDNTLTYSSLLTALALPRSTALESLITTCIYSNLLTARLSPTSTPPTVNITSVAPLRDLRPQSLPALLQILSTWSSRCDSVVSDLESTISNIRSSAVSRNTLAQKRQDIIDDAVLNVHSTNDNTDSETKKSKRLTGNPRVGNKRDLDDDGDVSDEDMDVDEGIGEMGSSYISTNSGQPSSMLLGGPSRGTKRNRGRG